MARVVRRYPNRKLYDTHARRYITLDALRALVAAGHDVSVVDQGTGEDITALTLAQVILEGVRERTARVPGQVLAAIVRLGAGPASAAAEWGPARAARRASDDAERIARHLIDRLGLDEAVRLRQEIAEAVQRGVAEAQHAAQTKLGELVRQLERQAAGHPALATIGSWLAGWVGEPARRTSWRRGSGRQSPAAARARAKRRGKRRRTPASGRSGPSAAAGARRSARSRKRRPSSGESSGR